MRDHLALAREYIARGEDFYRRAADEIIAAQRDDPTLGYRTIAERVGKSDRWCRQLVQWRTSADPGASPFVGDRMAKGAVAETTRTLRDAEPETVERIVSELPPERREMLSDALVSAEVPRARDSLRAFDAEDFNPSESWADALILRTNTNMRTLLAHVKRWGLVLGSLSVDDAYSHVSEIERGAAEIRVELQERIRDRDRVES